MERKFSLVDEQISQSQNLSFLKLWSLIARNCQCNYTFPPLAMVIHSYKELIVWQKSMDLVEEIYKITEFFPKTEQYGLTSQMRSSVTSIPFNIAEGRRRKTRKDFCKFLTIAYGSGSELETQIEVSKRLPFSKSLDFKKADSLLNEVMRMLNTIISKMKLPKLNS